MKISVLLSMWKQLLAKQTSPDCVISHHDAIFPFSILHILLLVIRRFLYTSPPPHAILLSGCCYEIKAIKCTSGIIAGDWFPQKIVSFQVVNTSGVARFIWVPFKTTAWVNTICVFHNAWVEYRERGEKKNAVVFHRPTAAVIVTIAQRLVFVLTTAAVCLNLKQPL